MTDTNSIALFKKSTLADSGTGNKKRMWKSLKQILATERTLQWPDDAVTCKFIVVSHRDYPSQFLISSIC